MTARGERLKQLLSLDELTKALKSLEKNKTPGSDGLLAEPYSSLWDLIGQDLLEVYNSMLLAAPFAVFIRKDVSLTGVTIPGSRSLQVKASLYVDDVTIFCSDPLSVSRLVSICVQFELALDAKVNQGKSESLFFGNQADRSFIPFTIRTDYLK
eukprot:g34926.t1